MQIFKRLRIVLLGGLILLSCHHENNLPIPYSDYIKSYLRIDKNKFRKVDSANLQIKITNGSSDKIEYKSHCLVSLYDSISNKDYISYIDLSSDSAESKSNIDSDFLLKINPKDSLCKMIKFNRLIWDSNLVSDSLPSAYYKLSLTISIHGDPENPGNIIGSNNIKIRKE